MSWPKGRKKREFEVGDGSSSAHCRNPGPDGQICGKTRMREKGAGVESVLVARGDHTYGAAAARA